MSQPAEPVMVSMPALVRIPAVEILHVGDQIPASTGPVTVTHEDLHSIIDAAAHPNAPKPVLKLGHHDPRFDGQPGFGRLINFRLSADGAAVLCDLSGVPAPIAHLLESAWPSRSIEMINGKHLPYEGLAQFTRVCTGLALLGAAMPAITRLEDITTITGLKEAAMNQATLELSAGLTMEDLWAKTRRALEPLNAFLHDMVHIQDEGLAAIYETPTTRVFQATINVDATTKDVTLSDPIEVIRTYAPIGPGEPVLMSVKPQGEDPMPTLLEEKLDQLITMLTGATQPEPQRQATEKDAPLSDLDGVEPPGQETEPKPVEHAEGELADDALADLMRRMETLQAEVAAKDAKTAALEQKVAALSAENARFVAEQRDAVFMAAIRDGRITPAERPAYESWAAKDPEGFAAHLSTLTPTNPTQELGHAETNLAASTNQDKLAGTPWA